MSASVWTTQHAAALKALREDARLDVSVLAKRHSLSTTQVRQLEDGGESAFYSPQIKWAVGRKLTLALGGEFIESAPPIASNPPAVNANTPPIPASPSVAGPVAMPMGSASTGRVNPIGLPPNTPDPPRRFAWWVTAAGLGLLLALGLSWSMRETAPVRPVPATLPVVAPPSEPATAPRDLAPAPTPGVAPAAVAAPAVGVVTTPLASDNEACRWVASPTHLTPAGGSRPDNYVHVVASEAVTVCWRDAEKKTRKQVLQANEATSFWGTPPFQVYASNPNTLKVYFKGQVVRWPTEAEHAHIVLGLSPGAAN